MIAGFLRSFRFRLKCGSYGISWFFHNASIRAASFLATAIRALPGGWSGSSIWMATKLRSRTSLRCVQLELGTRIRAGKSPREPRWTLLAWLARSRLDRVRERRTAHVPDRSRRTMASWYAGWSAKSRKPPPNRSQLTRRFTIRRGTGGFPGRWAAREIPSLSVRTAWPEFWISYKLLWLCLRANCRILSYIRVKTLRRMFRMTTGSTQCLHLIWTPGLHITASSLALRNRGKVDASGYSRSDRSMRRTQIIKSSIALDQIADGNLRVSSSWW